MTKSADLDLAAMELLGRALESPEAERRSWIEAHTEDNIPLRDAVLQLLQKDASESGAILTGQALKGAKVASNVPDRVGPYMITRLIGEGGMGAVFEGERADGDFDLRVAIKVIRSGLLSEALIDRFQRERQVLADMNHAGIARLFDGGKLDDGSPYFVMEYIDGEPITQWCERQGLSEAERLDIFRQACAALRYAHQNLIVHRDITPSNVMVRKDGAVKIIDFGIAKPRSEFDLTGWEGKPSLASLTFTPGYAAPERATGAPPTVLSDVYSLGKLLEEMLGGSTDNRELKAIADKASANSPDDRYPSIDALMEDIEKYANGYPVDALPGGAFDSLRKFVKRNKAGTFVGTVFLASLIAGLAVTASLYQQAEKARAEAAEGFANSRDFSLFIINEITPLLNETPGAGEIRNLLSRRTSEYLDQLDASDMTDTTAKFALAKSLYQTAEPAFNNVEFDESNLTTDLEKIRRAVSILESLEYDPKDEFSVNSALARALTTLAFAQFKIDMDKDYSSYVNLYERAKLIYDELALEFPDEPEPLFRRAHLQSLILGAMIVAGRTDVDIGREADELAAEITRLRQSFPDYAEDQSWFLKLNNNLFALQFRKWTNDASIFDEVVIPLEEQENYEKSIERLADALALSNPFDSNSTPTVSAGYQYIMSAHVILYAKLLMREWDDDSQSAKLQHYNSMVDDLEVLDAYLDRLALSAGSDHNLLAYRYYSSVIRMVAALRYAGNYDDALEANLDAISADTQAASDYPEGGRFLTTAQLLVMRAQMLSDKKRAIGAVTSHEICDVIQEADGIWSNPLEEEKNHPGYFDSFEPDRKSMRALAEDHDCI